MPGNHHGNQCIDIAHTLVESFRESPRITHLRKWGISGDYVVGPESHPADQPRLEHHMIASNAYALVLTLLGAGFMGVVVSVVWQAKRSWQAIAVERMQATRRTNILRELDRHIDIESRE